MRKKIIGILIIGILVILVASIAYALPSKRGLKAPPEFVANLPESKLTKIVFIRYAPGFQKDKPCDYDGVCDPDEKGWCADCKGNGEEPPTTVCYNFLSGSKPRWNWVENYYYSEAKLGTTSAWATATWDAATSATIFGDGLAGNYPWGKYDYYNSISYGDYPESGVIAVTAIWFRGKNIYEYDIMFDIDYLPDGGVDLETVTLHEFGHGAGLNDLYNVACEDNVMYGYYTGIKTALGSGDIAGIQTLYGK